MGLNWSDLRTLNGSQRDGFEELCAQLARLETPTGAEFIRKGSPDAGVECFCTLEDGRVWGWQAKFFRESLGDSQWRQLDRSVGAALVTHENLARYFVCVPRNRSDGRRPGVTTEKQKWEHRVSTWEGWARELGREVEFVWWGASEIADLLSQDRQAGRLRFWFGSAAQFSDDWFAKQLERAIGAAGPRYSPAAVHVDVPIVEDFELFGRSEAAAAAVRDVAKEIRQTPTYTLRRLAEDEASGALGEMGEVVESVDEVVAALYGLRCLAHVRWPLADIISDVHGALRRLSECESSLSVAAEEHNGGDETEGSAGGYRSNPYREATYEVRSVKSALWRARDRLTHFERVLDSDLMIVTGEAGAGKTHLLCDVASKRLAEGSPTVVLMGHQFTTNDPPWVQARAHLDLPDLSTEQFVGALEASTQAADTRALFVIDAINEGEGYTIWPAHLTDLVRRLQESCWIAVVVSVRSPFVDHIIPDAVRETAYEVEHRGFADDPYAAVERFCEHYDLEFPATPLLRREFDNPLFLKTLCEGLHKRGERRIPVGSEGIAAVFDRHLSEIDKTLSRERDHDQRDRIVARAVDAVASELAERGTRELPMLEAKDLVDPLSPARGFRRSLYRALVDNGLLMEFPSPGRDQDWTVAFGYEWFADHLIAKHLIERRSGAQELTSALFGDERDGGAGSRTVPIALLEALSVQAPERLGIELPEVLTGLDTPGIRRAFLRGLPWRDPTKIGPACGELIGDLLATTQPSAAVDIFDALVACAVVPDHPLGAVFLDEHLRGLPMADRDAIWSHYLHLAYGRQGPVDRLLDWAEKHPGRVAALDYDTAAACATVLAWCLSASHRFVRDRATKGLVAVLTNKIALTCEMVECFGHVDDPYVGERVMAAAYGVAMRSTDAPALAQLADVVYQSIFAAGEPPAHILLRDYARGVIERALHLGADISVDTVLVEPPYRSEWPHIPDDTEMEALDPPFRPDEPERSDAEKALRAIAFSVMAWDFARYVIGTNSSSESHYWLSVPITDSRWQRPHERAEAFRDSLDCDLRESFDVLWTRTRSVERFISFASTGAEPESAAAEDSTLPYIVKEPYLDPILEEPFLHALNEEQMAAYQKLKGARGSKEPRLSLDIIQRYVLWRAFDLGWTIERFGELDSRISRSDSYSGRDTCKPERIGKKYQWIAYHEILAHISDHFQYLDPYDDAAPTDAYRGAWQLHVRDIDPSAVLTDPAPRRRQAKTTTTWWRHDAPIAPAEDLDHEQWLRQESDIPSSELQLLYTNPDDGSNWIKLQGMDTWQTPTPMGYDRHEVDHREIWLYACSYLIDESEVPEFISWSKTVDFWGRWMPEPPGDSRLFFGELGWSFASQSLLGDNLGAQHPAPRDGGPRCPIPLQPTTYECSPNAGEYDCSLAHRHDLYRPNPRIVETMSLQWTGHGADFAHTDGTLAAFDPSAHDTCSSAQLVHEASLARFLNETRTALVWANIGEKRAVSPRGSRKPWAGFLQITDACLYQPERLRGHRTTRLEIADQP